MRDHSRKKIDFTPEQINNIVNCPGVSGQKMADKYGCSKQVIHRVRRENGLLNKNETPTPKATKTKSGLNIFEEEKRLIEEGRKFTEAYKMTQEEEIAQGLKKWETLPDGKTRIE